MGRDAELYWVVSDRVLCPTETTKEQRVQGSTSVGALSLAPRAICVEGATIVDMRPADELRRGQLVDHLRLRNIRVFDLGSSPVVPGWVNAHTHLAMAPLRGITSLAARSTNVVSDVFFRLESQMTGEDILSFTKMGAYESLVAGGLFVFDHYYHGRKVAQALREVGLSGVVAPTLQDRGGPYRDAWEDQLQASLDIHSDNQYSKRGVFAAYGPHAADTVSPELMAQVGELSRRDGLPVHMHLMQSFEEVQALTQSGATTEHCVKSVAERLERCEVLIAHGLHLCQGSIETLVGRRWVLGYCPYSQLQFGFLGPVRTWLEAGGSVALGTDCVASNDALDVQRELALLGGNSALLASFSPERAALLKRGTLERSAEVERVRKAELGRAHLIDSDALMATADGRTAAALLVNSPLVGACRPLSIGALANFLVLDENHPSLYPDDDLPRLLSYGSTSTAIKWGVVAGRMVGREDGWQRQVLQSEEYKQTRAEAERRRLELLQRAGLS